MQSDRLQQVGFTPRPRIPKGAIWCREQRQEDGGADILTLEKDKDRQEAEKGLRCKVCGLVITNNRERCSRGGRHLHTFFNPAGIVYEIGCFQKAPGCHAYGPASDEFAWFAGYRWRVVYCAECIEHLGWYFTAGQDGFFGLIVNRLREG